MICAAVGAVVGTRPRTRCVTSEVSGFRLAVTLAVAAELAGASTEDSTAGVPSTSLNEAVRTNGAAPCVVSENLPLASVSADWTVAPLLSVNVTTAPTSGVPVAATPLTV